MKDKEEVNGLDAGTLFRSLFASLNKKGSRICVHREDFICDPINGNILIEVELKKIMPSNARPYLVDCYTFDAETGSRSAWRSIA